MTLEGRGMAALRKLQSMATPQASRSFGAVNIDFSPSTKILDYYII